MTPRLPRPLQKTRHRLAATLLVLHAAAGCQNAPPSETPPVRASTPPLLWPVIPSPSAPTTSPAAEQYTRADRAALPLPLPPASPSATRPEAAPLSPPPGLPPPSAAVELVAFTAAMQTAVAAESPHLAPLLDTADDWLGTPYVWGAASPGKGLDCSNFTWLLARAHGLAYDRYLNTHAMSRLNQSHGLKRINIPNPTPDLTLARPGDLLVYGYYDEPEIRRGWHGHVVILIDPTGQTTGHPGLVLGAHGGAIKQVAYVVADGYPQHYFRTPRNQLLAILRPVEFDE